MRRLALHPRLEFSYYFLSTVDFLKKPLHDILPLVRKLLSEKIKKDAQKINGINFDLPLKAVRSIFEAQYFDQSLSTMVISFSVSLLRYRASDAPTCPAPKIRIFILFFINA
jgi:hypothetical protein